MRVLLGLAALAQCALLVSAQQTMTLSLPGATPQQAKPAVAGLGAYAVVYIYQNSVSVPNQIPNANINNGGNQFNTGTTVQNTGTSWPITVGNTVSTIIWTFLHSQYAAQIQYRYTGYNTGGGNALTYICDPCCTSNPNQAAGLTSTCSTGSSGPALSPTGTANPTADPTNGYAGYNCASFTRQYTYANLAVGPLNSFSVQIFNRNANPGPDTISYSFTVNRASPPIIGDPQIYGLQGQDFQVHGIPDEIFNLITYPNLQVNARFVYLSSAECHDNFTACFAHPGTYIGEEGIRIGNDKIHVKAGSYKKGLTVSVNGQRVSTGKHNVKLGSVNIQSHRRVLVNTPVMTITISNSDKFLNQETSLRDQKLLSLGAERRVLADSEQFHPEVPLHGLQGQTWRNVEYPSGLEYEGSINDYHVIDGNLFGTDFVFNQFKL